MPGQLAHISSESVNLVKDSSFLDIKDGYKANFWAFLKFGDNAMFNLEDLIHKDPFHTQLLGSKICTYSIQI